MDYQTSLFSLGLSMRANTVFRNMGVKTVGEFLAFSRNDIMKTKGAGRSTLLEIEAAIEKSGFQLGELEVDSGELIPD